MAGASSSEVVKSSIGLLGEVGLVRLGSDCVGLGRIESDWVGLGRMGSDCVGSCKVKLIMGVSVGLGASIVGADSFVSVASVGLGTSVVSGSSTAGVLNILGSVASVGWNVCLGASVSSSFESAFDSAACDAVQAEIGASGERAVDV